MKILYIHQYFRIPSEPGGTRSYWIAKELVNRNHQVIMVTSTNKYHPNPGIEMIDDIEVHYIENAYDNYMSKISKVKSFITFLYKAIKDASKLKDIDIMYASSTPLTIGGVALALKKRKKWPYVFEVRDLWPEFPIQVGAIKNKFLIKLLRKFEKSIYENANHVVGLSPGMIDGIVAVGTPVEKTTMIPNMAKPEEFFPHEKSYEIASQFGIDLSHFNVIHFGSMGRANGLKYLIEAAKELDSRDIDFIFMGGGATEPKLKAMVEKYNLHNVKFLGNHPMKTVMEVVNCCDLSFISFMNLPILKTNSPNKLFDSLSAAIPIAVNSAGWTKDMVEENDCGFYADVDNPKDLANKILEIKDNKKLLVRWSKNARKLSETTYNRKNLTAKVADVIENAMLQ